MKEHIEAPKAIHELKVLIVDNQSLVHEQIASALKEIGVFGVEHAHNAYNAVRACQENTFDIVLLSFNVSHDKDGFHLFEEFKHHQYITEKTTVVFLSAETSAELVNCIIELQPDDFWAKPLGRQKMQQRLHALIEMRRKLNKLLHCLYSEDYAAAIYHAERQLVDPMMADQYPRMKRIVGECLMNLREYAQAEKYYASLTDEYPHAWVQIGLAKSLLRQDKTEAADTLIEALLLRDDTRFKTYDLLAQYYIEKAQFDVAYEQMKQAVRLAPRNIERNKKLWDLARLNRDKAGQLDAVQKMAKYAKNSIHDSPELTLNVARSMLDLASTASTIEAAKLIQSIEKELEPLHENVTLKRQLSQQLSVIQVRSMCLNNEKNDAEQLITGLFDGSETHLTMEDNLDLMKAYHQLGMRENCLRILDTLREQIAGDSFSSRVVDEYLQQEAIERREIQFTTKELKDMAAVNYRENRFGPAYHNLRQALVLSPENKQIALSMLKVMVLLHRKEHLDEEQLSDARMALDLLEASDLGQVQRQKCEEYAYLLGINKQDSVEKPV